MALWKRDKQAGPVIGPIGSQVREEQRVDYGATLLDGAAMADKLRAKLAQKIADSKIRPGLAVILVGEDPASQLYVDFKMNASKQVGMYLKMIALPEDVSQKKLLKVIQKLNKKKKIHGILVQLPLPKHLNEFEIMQAVAPEKDVDGFNPVNIGWLSIGDPEFVPATTRGIMRLLVATKVDLIGKHAVVVGTSNIVGKPTAQWLLNEGATVTLCNSKTANLAFHTRQADILVTATGVAGLIDGDMVKTGAIVIDAGIAKKDDVVVGDCVFEEVAKKASFITPVPGGVGPMTVAALLENTYLASERLGK